MEVIFLLSAVVLGVVLGRTFRFVAPDGVAEFLLYVLVFVVGLDLSREKLERRVLSHILMASIATVVGTLASVAMLAPLLGLRLTEVLAAASGFGWYSLSAIVITNSYSAVLGSISFFSNVMRELIAVVILPFGIRLTRYGTISVAGATSMDTLLGLVAAYADREAVLVSFGHGFVVSMLVPVFVNLFVALSR